MELIILIVIIYFISKSSNKAGKAAGKANRNSQQENVWNQADAQIGNRQSQSRQYASTDRSSSSGQNDKWKKLARENIEKARKRATEKLREVEQALEIEDNPAGTYEMPKRNVRTNPAKEQINRSAAQQVYAGREAARNTSILERAVKNADEDKVDVTLETMEREHNHSERVSAAEHHHPEDVIPENMLGTIEDLMIKGYDGQLCFERDFVGEAMDMISYFTVPSDIPGFL